MTQSGSSDGPDSDAFDILIENGDVWVRWPERNANVKLGPADIVMRKLSEKMAEIALDRRAQAVPAAPPPETLADVNFRLDPDLDPGR